MRKFPFHFVFLDHLNLDDDLCLLFLLVEFKSVPIKNVTRSNSVNGLFEKHMP